MLLLHCEQVCVELVGYLLEELRDAKNFANFQKDVASGTVVGQPCCLLCVVGGEGAQHSHCRVAAPLPAWCCSSGPTAGGCTSEADRAACPPSLLPSSPAANIFIGSLIFIEELADKIVQAVGPCRDSLDACLIFPSMPAVMKLNKLGSFSMSQLGERSCLCS